MLHARAHTTVAVAALIALCTTSPATVAAQDDTPPDTPDAQAPTAGADDATSGDATPDDDATPAPGAEGSPDGLDVQADISGDAALAGPETPEADSDGAQGVVEEGAGLFEQSLSGETDSESDDAAGSTSGFDLDGYVRSDIFIGGAQKSDVAELDAGYGELSLQVRGPRQPLGSAYADLRARYGKELETRELQLDLREAYVDLFAGPVDVRLGQQIIVWGRADAFNPTNNLMPLDLRVRSPVEDDRRVGNLGARVFYNLAPVRIEAVWLPLYVPTQYPQIELEDYIVMDEPRFPSPTLDNGLAAGRVHLELPSFEASVSYVNGNAPLPGLGLISYTVGVTPTEVHIARTAYRQHVVGLDFSTAISDELALRGEVAYRRPNDYENRVHAARPDLQYVLGADRAFGPVTLIVQYMGRYVQDWQREDGPDTRVTPDALSNFDPPPLPRFVEESITTRLEEQLAATNQVLFAQTERVQHSLTVRPEWVTLHDTLSVSALGMVNFSTQEWLLFPKAEYHISDALRASVGAEIYFGPDDTLFDLIDHKLTAGYAELRYTF